MQSARMLEKLTAMNATKTEFIRQCNLAIIIAVDTLSSSAWRVCFDRVVNYEMCAHDC